MRVCVLGEPDNYYTRNERDDARLDALADMFMVGSVVEQRASALDRKVSRAYKRKKKRSYMFRRCVTGAGRMRNE